MVIKNQIANMMTFLSLSLGVLAIFIMLKIDNPLIPVILITFCGILDRYDGKVARHLNIESDLGKQLDSFTDLIVFIISPIVFICQLNLFGLLWVAFLAILLFVSSGLYRLARFNLSDQKTCQSGLPTTVAGMMLIWYSYVHHIFKFNESVLIVIIVLLSFLMISRFAWKKI